VAEPPVSTPFREHVFLFRRFLRSPRTVGALTPSSRALASAMIDALDLGPGKTVAELGPGTGALTARIVERLDPGARFLAVDIDSAFVEQVRLRWPHVECVCASAEQLHLLAKHRGMFPLDHIVSGLPFVSLPSLMTKQILESVCAALRPGGTFTTFQYLHGYGLSRAADFRTAMSARMTQAAQTRVVLRNVPPAIVISWTKS
jgi:phosphatidylethanolamine/phosphatidyl-N-methylethanolamine N-methyltransferase